MIYRSNYLRRRRQESSVAAHATALSRLRLSAREQSQLPSYTRHFSYSAAALKAKQQRQSAKERHAAKDSDRVKKSSSNSSAAADAEHHAEDDEHSAKHPASDSADPLNFADVTSRWAAADAHFRDAIKKLCAGGRFNPDVIGALQVQPDRKSTQTFPLRELAEVVPRGGRTISLLVHEREYLKPIVGAIQASADFNQQPQRDPDNELELLLKVELERKEDQVKRLKTLCQGWKDRVRAAKAKREKQLDKWAKDKTILVDINRKGHDELGKMQKKKFDEIDKAEEQAIRALDRMG